MAPDIRLYGRSSILESFAAWGIRRRPIRPLPLLLLIGRRGSGKTAVLHELRRLASGWPCAFLDLDSRRNDSVVGLLGAIVFQLSEGHRGLGRLKFPRFLIGQLAAQLNLTGLTQDAARQAVHTLLDSVKRYRRLPPDVRQLLGQVLQAAVPGPAPVPDAVLSAFELTLRLWRAPGKRWWGDDGPAADRLVELNRQLHDGTQRERDEATEALGRAFLADLRSAYGNVFRGPDRTVASVALLDNAHLGAGTDLLRLLARLRASAVGAEPPDQLLLAAATGRRPDRLNLATPVDPDRLTWDDSRLGQGHAWFCPVELRDLTAREVTDWAERSGLSRRSGLAVTGGLPGAVSVLLELNGDPERLLLPDSPAVRSLETILDDFPESMRSALISAAAAEDCSPTSLNAALRDATAGQIRQLRTLLSERFWLAEDQLHPWLRALLLVQLRSRGDDDPDGWQKTHTRLLALHGSQARPDAARFHELALGRLRPVVCSVEAELDTKAPADWIALVRRITLAPHRRRRPADISGVAELSRWAADEPHRVLIVARLMAAHWLAADPFVRSGPDLFDAIADEYEELASLRPDGYGVFFGEAERFRGLALGRRIEEENR
ncbi:hypothetical protein [Longispora fulva]|uniref:Uncharacterized protein n=1 Tax=Longispora fulva TaxID=619741 RepID=A0A8J7GF08_9ACTN|nr:hypothetical protein [Longispora fulva]MBG6134633.1 hypothetical protein [Longispora fulva]